MSMFSSNTYIHPQFKLKNEKQRVLMVEERFSELADNHGELIKSSLENFRKIKW